MRKEDKMYHLSLSLSLPLLFLSHCSQLSGHDSSSEKGTSQKNLPRFLTVPLLLPPPFLSDDVKIAKGRNNTL